MNILPVNNQTITGQTFTPNKQNVNFKAYNIPSRDEAKIIALTGDKLCKASKYFLGVEDIPNIWYTLKEIKKAFSFPSGTDLKYLAKKAKKPKTLTWEDCQKAFVPFEEAKKATAQAQKNEEAAFNNGLATLGVI